MRNKLYQYKNEFLKFLRSTDFSKAIVLTFAILVPVVTAIEFEALEIGISIAMGCLLCSPSDVTGSFKHKILGIISASVLASISFLIAGYSEAYFWLVIPMLIVMMFGLSYLSVFGFRASLVSFSGLLAVVLSFANLSSGIEIWQKSLLILAGGFWYLILSTSWYLIRPKRATEQMLAETMEITARFLRTRTSLLNLDTDRKEAQKELFSIQNELNELHESLRELLISSRKASGQSGYQRKRLLIFIDLVDILELAMANPIDYRNLQRLFGKDREDLIAFIDFNLKIAAQLDRIALSLYKNDELPENHLPETIEITKDKLIDFSKRIDLSKDRETMLTLRNFFDYQVKQAQKVNSIDRILRNLEEKRKIFYKEKEVQKVLTPQEYNFKTLQDNFNFDSIIFRHSLRLSLIVIVGYLIGDYFSVQNSYWILLTIIVIMRPNYGLTKERSRKRMVGTLIGGAVAVGIVFITQNMYVYAVLGLLSLTFAFSLIQRNYTTAAIFVTLSIIFIYALLKPGVLNVIQFRVLDTLIGAALAALGNLILWPKWELSDFNQVLVGSLDANINYLSQIDYYYHSKGNLPISYKLARKKAFLEMGNLSGAFQRMTQEPRSKQRYLGQVYEIVGLNQTFLSALASLGTYIRTHPTTRASSDFETYTGSIKINMNNSIKILKGGVLEELHSKNLYEAGKSLNFKFEELSRKRDREIQAGKDRITTSMRHKLQEAHLVKGQLEWLHEISGKIFINSKKLKEEII